MVGEWPTRKLADLCDSVDYGYTAAARDAPCGPKFLRITDIVSGSINWDSVPFCEIEETSLDRFRLHNGDVVIARTGATTGYSAYIASPPDAVFASYLVRLKVNREASARFIAYFLKSSRFWAYMRGVLGDKSAQPNASAATMTQVSLAVPPLKEQQAIACVLGALDDRIELNRRRNETLEATAQAIFKSWFVDFDPVRTKAAGRHPPGLKPDLAALFPNAFEDSELGEIPRGWRVGTVGDLAEINGWTLGKRDTLDHIDYIEISEVVRGEIANIAHYSRGSEPGRARRRLRHGDTAISTVRPDRGSYFLSIEPLPSLMASTGFAVLTASAGHWAFVHVLTTRKDFGEELGRLADGGAYPAVRPEVIAARPVVIPAPEQIISVFEKIAQPIFLRADGARLESRTLAAIRDALLPKLVSGELLLSDAKRIVERAL